VKYRAFYFSDDIVYVIDQRLLPFVHHFVELKNSSDVIWAIKDMVVRGAGVIGNIGAFGAYFAIRDNQLDLIPQLRDARPTAVNLAYSVDRVINATNPLDEVHRLCEEDRIASENIAIHGANELMKLYKNRTLNIMTHCNAGFLAIIDKGSALAPIYKLQEMGIDIHIWVSETRPRNQGSYLTAWELREMNIPHTVIADNTAGLLMKKGMVDACIVGADRVVRNGDTANKIGTYLKALASFDNNIPFYVALPSSTFDFSLDSGDKIEIEERGAEEMEYIRGYNPENKVMTIKIIDDKTLNYGFDVTPNRLITKFFTEKGSFEPNKIDSIYGLN
jgi:methylthioribose-1-phosphate isomerase